MVSWFFYISKSKSIHGTVTHSTAGDTYLGLVSIDISGNDDDNGNGEYNAANNDIEDDENYNINLKKRY